MKRLFADNFRGFSNTYIPLLDVNFLVGENSSGKTSILEAIKLFSSPQLFLGPEFGGDSLDFGHFMDLVSAHSEDRTYFRLGLTDDAGSAAKDAPMGTAILFTYRDNGGVPEVRRFTYASGAMKLNLLFEGDEVLYRSESLRSGEVSASIDKVFAAMLKDHREDAPDDGWSTLDLPKAFREKQVPLFIILSLASRGDSNFPMALPHFGAGLAWIAPMRAKPRKTYADMRRAYSSEGSHTPYVIRRMLNSRSEAKKFESFMCRVGRASGLFESIKVHSFGDAVDITTPFEVEAVLDGKAINVNTVGYGVSQSLPIFVELIDRAAHSWFAIQQPEVHLHPRAQAALGDVFFEMAVRDRKSFVIETHSDFTIDRFRMNYRKRAARRPSGQVLFFERHNQRNTVTPLPISPDGGLPSRQPDGYRRFFVKEELRLLGL